MTTNTPEIDPAEAAALLASDDAPLLLDVRNPWEAAICRIGDALLIPLGSLPYRLQEVPEGRRILVYCHHGMRSLMAAQLLNQAGYDALSVRGGIERWATEIEPGMARY